MLFREIVGQLNCHLSNKLQIYNQFVSSCSTEKKTRIGRSIKISERGGRLVCFAAKFIWSFKTFNKSNYEKHSPIRWLQNWK